MIRRILVLCLLSIVPVTGCSKPEKSAVEILAEKELAKRRTLLTICKTCQEVGDFAGLGRWLKSDPSIKADPEFSSYWMAYTSWDTEQRQKGF